MATIITQQDMCKVKFTNVIPPSIRPISEAIRTFGGSPIAVAAPPIFEKITVAIKT